jgi:hypothetical protein
MLIRARWARLVFFVIPAAGFAQNFALTLASGSGAPGSSIPLDLTLNADQADVTAIQWTMRSRAQGRTA